MHFLSTASQCLFYAQMPRKADFKKISFLTSYLNSNFVLYSLNDLIKIEYIFTFLFPVFLSFLNSSTVELYCSCKLLKKCIKMQEITLYFKFEVAVEKVYIFFSYSFESGG